MFEYLLECIHVTIMCAIGSTIISLGLFAVFGAISFIFKVAQLIIEEVRQ